MEEYCCRSILVLASEHVRSCAFLLLAFIDAVHVDTVVQILAGHVLTLQGFLTIGPMDPSLGLHYFRFDELDFGIHLYYVLFCRQCFLFLDN